MVRKLVLEDMTGDMIKDEDAEMEDRNHVYGLKMCKEMINKMVEEAVYVARMKPCRQLVEQDLTNRVWKRVEHKRILKVIEYESLAGEIENSLREARLGQGG